MRTFTSEEFKGYEFQCTTESANQGFKHVCKVLKDSEEITDAKSIVNWGNRTWESYQYASVFEDSKSKLQSILEGLKKPEIDYDFLCTLACEGYIHDYGELENGEPLIIFDSWEQAEGESHYEDEYDEDGNYTGYHKVITKPSVYQKLRELAEKNLLKPSVQSTIETIEFGFSDQFMKCDDCGKIYDYSWGDLTWCEEEEMYLCDNCINSSERVEGLIEDAKKDFRKALKPTISENIIRELGYELVTDETFSFAQDRWCVLNTTEEWVQDFITKYNGFVQIYQVEQFDCPFQIWVSNDMLESAQEELKKEFAE